MDGGAWRAAVHGVAKSRTRLSDFTFAFHFHALEKEMATHSSVLAWRIPGQGSLVGFRLWASVYGITQSRTRLKRLNNNNNNLSYIFLWIGGPRKSNQLPLHQAHVVPFTVQISFLLITSLYQIFQLSLCPSSPIQLKYKEQSFLLLPAFLIYLFCF